MSILDSVLKQVSGSPDTIASLAEKVGLDPALAEKAVAALGQSHPEEGDTVELAAEKTGIDTGTLGNVVEQMGGEQALNDMVAKVGGDSKLGGLMQMLDRDGDGSPIDDVLGMAKGLFGKK